MEEEEQPEQDQEQEEQEQDQVEMRSELWKMQSPFRRSMVRKPWQGATGRILHFKAPGRN